MMKVSGPNSLNSSRAMRIAASTQSSTKRGRRWARSTTACSSGRFISSKISELIDSSTMRSRCEPRLARARRLRAVDLAVAALGAADPQRADAALVVSSDRHVLEDALDLVVGEAVGEQ